MGVYIPNMSKPKKGEVIAFDGECAVYTDDDMQVHRYPLIEIVRCGECKHRDPEDKKCDCGMFERQGCIFPVADDYFCKYGERRADENALGR